jgi:hypothetical protein
MVVVHGSWFSFGITTCVRIVDLRLMGVCQKLAQSVSTVSTRLNLNLHRFIKNHSIFRWDVIPG